MLGREVVEPCCAAAGCSSRLRGDRAAEHPAGVDLEAFWQARRERGATTPTRVRWRTRAQRHGGRRLRADQGREGFEDLTAFGRKQIGDLGVGPNDVTFAITEAARPPS